MNTIDTRDLIERRDELKQDVLDSFKDTFEHYADDTDDFEYILWDEEEIQSWREDWYKELEEIEDIDDLENEIDNGEFDYGITLIPEDYFVEYCKDLVSDIGDLPRDLPFYIENNIDWDGVADDLKQDYSEVEFRGETYLYR
jgi:hypothetical protein